MEKKISVIVPVYNVDTYLRECIDSIINQTYNNLEIILVDDGSTDNSKIICDEYAQIDNRIIVIHKENSGLSDARNEGINISSGEFITLVDSDDKIALDMIEYLYNLADISNCDISVCQRLLINEEGYPIPYKIKRTESKLITGRNQCMESFFKESYIDTVAWGKLYRSSLFKDIRYPTAKYHEDDFTTYKLIAKCQVISIGFEQKYYYRIRKGSITNSNFSPRHLDLIKAKEEQYEFVRREYPKLKKIVEGGIVYASNKCLLKIIKSSINYTPFLNEIRNKYKIHIKSYLLGKYSLMGKFFAILGSICPELLITILRKIYHYRNN